MIFLYASSRRKKKIRGNRENELRILISRSIMELKFVVLTIMVCVSMGTTSPSKIERVEKNLLSMFGMKRRPNVDRKKISIPQEMFDIYEEQINHEFLSTAFALPGKLTSSANTLRSYTHEVSPIDDRFQSSHRFRLSFNLTDFPANEIVTSSELRLTIVPKENNTGSLESSLSLHQRVNVYDIIKPGIKGETRPILRLIDTKLAHVHTTSDTAILVDVLPIIERWISNQESNYGLLIDIRTPKGEKVASSPVRLKRLAGEDDNSWHVAQPLLFVYSDDKNVKKLPIDWTDPKRRTKRNTTTNKTKKKREECRRHHLWVDFEKVGWNDWIVAPPGYEAYFCAGDCPSQFGDHLNATNHAIVQALVHTVHPHAIPKPCCVPTKLEQISMLYLDEHNKTVLKNYPDMVVEGCGCR